MKKIITLLLLSTIMLPAFATLHVVQVSDFSYSPSTLNIMLNDTVLFQHVSGDHPTASTNGGFLPFPMNAAQPVHMIKFTTTGTFPYHCTAHTGMAGVINVATVSATPQLVKSPEVSVYPNPASDVINVSHNLDRIDGVKITNMIGQQVRFVKSPIGSTNKMQLNIADLPKGMYMVNLQANGATVFTKRIIKDR